MSFTIVDKPVKVIQADIPENSKWSAVWHPIVFKFQRQDFVVTDIADAGSSPDGVNISATGDFTSELEIGQKIFVNADNGNQYGVFEIMDFSYNSGTNKTTIEYDGVSAVSMTPNGFANLIGARTFYMIEVAIYSYKNGVSTLISSDNPQYRPDKTGLIKADLRAFLQTLVDAHDVFDYIQRSEAMPNAGARYDIQVREYWKESGFTEYTTGGQLSNWNYIHAAKQIGDLYGQNMGQYVMFPPNVTYEHNKGKFLTMFERPTYFSGFPFELDFIYDKSITDAGNLLSIVEIQKDINNSVVTTTDDLIDDDNSFVVAATLKAIHESYLYASNVKKIDFYLKAVTEGGDPVDPFPVLITMSTLVGFPPNVQLVNMTSGKTIGYTTFNTDTPTTMAQLANSINTNTPNGTPFNGTYPFDNSQGFTSIYTSGNQISVYAPSGSGTSYNGQSLALFFSNANGSVLYSDNPFAGGSDGDPVDANALTTPRVSEIKGIDVDATCYDNPILLRWLNPLGGRDFWLFNRNQIVTSNISNEQTYEKYIENLEDTTERMQVLSKDSQDEIDVAAELLDISKMKGIKHLLSSIKVDMYVPNVLNDSLTNFSWVSVRIKPSSFELYETNETKTRIELTIVPPQKYNQQS